MANTLNKFYEKLIIAFGIANKKILDRIHCEIRDSELVVIIKSEKQGSYNCINASVISVRPAKTHQMMVEKIMVGFDSDGYHWSDHMGGTIVDCSGLNVQCAIEKIVDGMSEHI